MKKGWIVSLVCFLLVSLCSLGGAYAAEPAMGKASLRIVHASPDAPAVDVYVDGKPAAQGVSYKQATSYLMLPSGSHAIAVYPVSAGGTGKPLQQTTLVLEAGKKVTVNAVNKAAQLELLVTTDADSASADKSKVRFIHVSPDAPAVDVAVKGGDVLFANTAFKGVTPYAELPPGKVDLEVRLAGKPDVVLAMNGVELKPNQINDIYAVGLVNGQPKLESLVLTEGMPAPKPMPTSAPQPTAAPKPMPKGGKALEHHHHH